MNDLTFQERKDLNKALGKMKTLSSHGEPYMCDNDWWEYFVISIPSLEFFRVNVFPSGGKTHPCCDHGDKKQKLFVAWHRPFMKVFELALHNAGLEASKGHYCLANTMCYNRL